MTAGPLSIAFPDPLNTRPAQQYETCNISAMDIIFLCYSTSLPVHVPKLMHS